MRILAIDVPSTKHGGYALGVLGMSDSVGTVDFASAESESECLRRLAMMITQLRPDLVVLEWPFLHTIAGVIGGAKMVCALHNIPWWMVGASRAKKTVLGKGNATKKEVLEWARLQMPGMKFTQHQADSLLYLHCWRMLHERANP